jgi:hypothetical protein
MKIEVCSVVVHKPFFLPMVFMDAFLFLLEEQI